MRQNCFFTVSSAESTSAAFSRECHRLKLLRYFLRAIVTPTSTSSTVTTEPSRERLREEENESSLDA